MNIKKINHRGQITIVLLLLLLAALSVALAVTQRSITNVATSTQSEESTRAFSAAEAGIEKATQTCPPGQPSCTEIDPISLTNQATAKVILSPPLPLPKQALEYPPLGKEEVAQFWLANPTTSPPATFYTASSFDIYFGNSDLTTTQDFPAIEVNVVTSNAGVYKSNRYYLDSKSRNPTNNFNLATCGNVDPIPTANYKNSPSSTFYCKGTIPYPGCSAPGCTAYTGTPIMARVRILYSTTKQSIALAPALGNSLPPQATLYTSTGNSGLSQKTISVFRTTNVVPPFFDYAIFSAGNITK